MGDVGLLSFISTQPQPHIDPMCGSVTSCYSNKPYYFRPIIKKSLTQQVGIFPET